MIRLRPILLTLAMLATLPALAAPARYGLEPQASSVTFTYTLLGETARGTMPVSDADLTLDFVQVANSRARVELDVTRAQTGVGFVTGALKSPELLDAAAHPRIRFVSTRVVPTETGARISGNVTIRGVTRPMVLEARIYRRRGSAEGDLSRLTVLLTGEVRRRTFGATGYPEMVGDRIVLDIRAEIFRRD